MVQIVLWLTLLRRFHVSLFSVKDILTRVNLWSVFKPPRVLAEVKSGRPMFKPSRVLVESKLLNNLVECTDLS